jgi:hypothetical protein
MDKMKPEVPIFPRHETESKEESEGGQEEATPPSGLGASWPCHHMVWGPGHPLTSPLRL